MLLTVLLIGYLLLQMRGVGAAWRAYRSRFPGAKFSYTILELYALILALTPTYLCVAMLYRNELRWFWCIPIFFFCQITGALQAKLWQGTPPGIPREAGSRPLPVEIAIGALKGLLLVIPLVVLVRIEVPPVLFIGIIACASTLLPVLAVVYTVTQRRQMKAELPNE